MIKLKKMKKLAVLMIALTAFFTMASAQGSNDSADSIIGTYKAERGGEITKVSVTKSPDGTYKAQVIWLANPKDKNGNIRLDEKNPDKSLRTTPCNQIIIFKGMKYNAEKKCWDGAKVYDPTMGIRANGQLTFLADGRLKIKGTLAGISQSVYWTRAE